jgi:hypothetical protein
MKQDDDFSDYYRELLEGRYDCPDRIVLNGYFALGGRRVAGFATGGAVSLDPTKPWTPNTCFGWRDASAGECTPTLSGVASPSSTANPGRGSTNSPPGIGRGTRPSGGCS